MARDLEREPERRPATASDGEAPAVAEAPGAGVSRRTLLGSGFALAASAGLLEAGGAPADALPDARAGSLQRASAHTLFRLPQDHKWHAGGIYATGQLEEWYYWTGFLTDAATKEQFGLFYNLFHEGSAPGKVGYRVWFALYNLDKNQFFWTVQNMAVPLAAHRPPKSTSRNDFQYTAHTANTLFRTTYRAKPDIWALRFKSVALNAGKPHIGMNLKLRTHTPYGYLPLTPYGVENENAPWTGKPNPTTMRALSYYYGAPKTHAAGTVTIGGKTHHLTGSLWMEHQWGNFSIANQPWTAAYIWSAIQFNNGSIFTFRQWYDQDLKPLLNLGRHSYSTPNNQTTYGFGKSVEFTPLKTWHSPVSGRNFPAWGRLTTEFGTWYYSPMFPNYELPFGYPPYGTSQKDIWEAPCRIHTGSIDGPVVGRAYLELPNILTASFPQLP